jgi:uracil phosphoribosyltransferase
MLTELKAHSLIQHNLSILRNKQTPAEAFRTASEAITQILMTEAARELPLEAEVMETPIETMTGSRLAAGTVLVPILRAGIGMLAASLKIIPNASVGFVGLERDAATALASCYYSKLPDLSKSKNVFVIDPMLATGGSAIQTIDTLKSLGVQKITLVVIIAAPEGIEALLQAHPDVPIITAMVDRELNDLKYICPGLGDFGDRLFQT